MLSSSFLLWLLTKNRVEGRTWKQVKHTLKNSNQCCSEFRERRRIVGDDGDEEAVPGLLLLLLELAIASLKLGRDFREPPPAAADDGDETGGGRAGGAKLSACGVAAAERVVGIVFEDEEETC